MDTGSLVYNELNKAWKSACKVLLVDEIGELKEYEDWVGRYVAPGKKRKSHISGQEVILSNDRYCNAAHFVSSGESQKAPAQATLSINEIKDIDSIVEALSDKWEYVGNRALGVSTNVESSDLIVDSHYVLESTNIQKSSYVFRSSLIGTSSKYVFGCVLIDEVEFATKCSGNWNTRRCVDSHWILDCSDIFFSYYCINCHDMLFSFNQKNKRCCVGNLELPKEKYLSLKSKLLSEIREELKRDKSFPSLFELVPNEKPKDGLKLSVAQELEGDIGPINKAFKSTFKVIFKKESEELPIYEKWLSSGVVKVKEVLSQFGATTFIPDDYELGHYSLYPEKRIVSYPESVELGNLQMDEKDTASLNAIRKGLSKIGYLTSEYSWGKNHNLVKSPFVYNATDVYKSFDTLYSQFVGLNSSSVRSKYVFGCRRIYDSQFCINCYDSHFLNRCFEVDTSVKCSDTYFAHNCEGLQEAMFCFNAKGKRHAIGNSELTPEQYRELRDKLVEEMAEEIIKNKSLKHDIFNVGCSRRA